MTPTTNADGSATYTITAATLAATGSQVPFPTATIESISILIDVEATADITNITVNGALQVPTTQAAKDRCKKGGWGELHEPVVQEPGRLRQLLRHGRQ